MLRRQHLTPTALLGREGEEAAYWHLRARGFVMVERNYRPQGLRGEIDLIGWEGDILVFIEVKTRRTIGRLMPETAVDLEKERNVVAAAGEYRRRTNQVSKPFRFDIVSIVTGGAVSPPDASVEHFRDAFRSARPASGNG